MTPEQIARLLAVLEGKEKIKAEISFNQTSVLNAVVIVILGALVLIIIDRWISRQMT